MSTPLRVLLVDDEPLARLRLRTLLEAMTEPRALVVGEAGDAAEAAALLDGVGADVVLLDIRMPGRSGMQLATSWRRLPTPPAVIFVTAHAEHALAAFEIEAVDYLTKPVRRDRLETALQRVATRLRSGAPPRDEAPVLVVSDRGRVLRLPLAEVLTLKAEQKYVTLRTATRSYVLDDALSDLEARLGEGFLRVHRNALVARHAVRALERRPSPDRDEHGADGWAVLIAHTGEWLAVSRRQVTAVRDALSERSRAP